jgi:hypothetical protein
MKNFEILLNKRFSASTQALTSGLDLENDYFVYINGNGGGMVNPYNVRGYLNDQRNIQITRDFFAFLTGSTSQDQALNILTSDKKLADTFNDYYQRVIISATQISSTAVIQQNLTGANSIVAYNYNHPWSGYAPNKQLTGITQEIYGAVNSTQPYNLWQEFTDEQSYYVPVYLERGTNQLARYKHEICDVFIDKQTAGFYPEFSGITSSYFGSASIANILANVVNSASTSSIFNTLASINIPASTSTTSQTGDSRIHTLLNCFVDLNLATNENVGTAAPLQKVSFQFSSYTINEGAILSVRVDLDGPSPGGIEQATINLINPVANPAIAGVDYLPFQSYPVTLSWSAGEQYKFLTFVSFQDYFIENLESFEIQISNIINLDPGNILNAKVDITDTTVLRTASIGVSSPATATQFSPGSSSITINEGDVFEVAVNLDGPAFGVEVVNVNLISSAMTISGPVGPDTNPGTLNTDYYISASSIVLSFAPGETQKKFLFSAFTDTVVETTESAFFELDNPQFCFIDSNKKVLTVFITDTTGLYKYTHINLGNIYSQFGEASQNILMRQIDPQASFFGGYNNMYINQYGHNLIIYGNTINFADYSGSYNSFHTHDSISYPISTVKLKITNTGTIQSIVNGNTILTGQTLTLTVPGNNFIITATTNSNKNTITNFYDYANYKLEIVNNYSGSSDFNGMRFYLRDLSNSFSSSTNSLLLGTYSFPGTTTVISNTTIQHKLKSTYTNVNTGRPNTGSYSSPVYVCPPVASFSYSISFSEFYAIDIEKISVMGIIFLGYDYNTSVAVGGLYNTPTTSSYDSFTFVTGATTTTCPGSNSSYNGLNYISIPFKLEP